MTRKTALYAPFDILVKSKRVSVEDANEQIVKMLSKFEELSTRSLAKKLKLTYDALSGRQVAARCSRLERKGVISSRIAKVRSHAHHYKIKMWCRKGKADSRGTLF